MHRPAHDAPGVKIHRHGRIQPALGRPDVGEVGHPFLVWRISPELAIQHVVGNGAAHTLVLGKALSAGGVLESIYDDLKQYLHHEKQSGETP